jgi:succinate-semialdehyde dehydrogenase/glutarate-semialdehyde dehydrogenase
MQMLIGGKKVNASDGKTINVINPATGKFIDDVPLATEQDVAQAVKNSKIGQKEWAVIPILERAKIFDRFNKLLEENRRELVGLNAREFGKGAFVANFEIEGVIPMFRSYVEQSKRLEDRILVGGTELGHDGKTQSDMITVVHEPLGTIAAIVPFNAPMLLTAYKVAPILCAGNACILKPPTDNPLSVIRMCELLLEAGVPGNTLQVITGNGEIVGKYLLTNPGVDGVTMTGSTEVGIGIAKTMAERLAHVGLELGGNDAFIVCEDADVDTAAFQAASTRITNARQVCIAPKRFIVHTSIKKRFTEKVLEYVASQEVGYDDHIEEQLDQFLGVVDCADVKVLIPCLINEKAAKKVEAQVNKTIEQGAKLLAGGKRNGTFYDPTVLECTKDMDIAKDMEIFGPVIPIIGFDTLEEAIEIANNSKYGLSGCVFTNDWKKGHYVASKCETGQMIINGTTMYRNMMQPFGGYKYSGIGNEGLITLEGLTRTKNIVMKGFHEYRP